MGRLHGSTAAYLCAIADPASEFGNQNACPFTLFHTASSFIGSGSPDARCPGAKIGSTPIQVWLSEVRAQEPPDDGLWSIQPIPVAVSERATRGLLPARTRRGLWEGLGYYSRARNLPKAARAPQLATGSSPHAQPCRRCRGIRRYTTGAAPPTAHQQDVPAVDANVESRAAGAYDIADSPKSQPEKGFTEKPAASPSPAGKARDFNQALMELGALVCMPRSPHDRCPWANLPRPGRRERLRSAPPCLRPRPRWL